MTSKPAVERIVDDKYRIVRPLKRGGMGVVCEAVELSTERVVALKLLAVRETAPLVGMPEDERATEKRRALVKRFHREARAASAVASPHIVDVFDTGTDPASDEPYMVMELLAGEDLRTLFKRLEVLRPDAALRIAAQACEGLACAHDAGIVHRDIKPANVFVANSEDGLIVKLLDFGIAKMRAPAGEESTDLTQTGAIIGSPHYMSPEQVQSLKSIDHRTDIWSMGVVLFRALSGRTPFANTENTSTLLVDICTKAPPPLREVAPWVAPEIAQVVDRALETDPEERFPTAAAMRDALCEALGSEPRLRDYHLTPLPMSARRRVDDVADSEQETVSSDVGGAYDAESAEAPSSVDVLAVAQSKTSAAAVSSAAAPARTWPWVIAAVVLGATGYARFATAPVSPDAARSPVGVAGETDGTSAATADPRAGDDPVLPTSAAVAGEPSNATPTASSTKASTSGRGATHSATERHVPGGSMSPSVAATSAAPALIPAPTSTPTSTPPPSPSSTWNDGLTPSHALE